MALIQVSLLQKQNAATQGGCSIPFCIGVYTVLTTIVAELLLIAHEACDEHLLHYKTSKRCRIQYPCTNHCYCETGSVHRGQTYCFVST